MFVWIADGPETRPSFHVSPYVSHHLESQQAARRSNKKTLTGLPQMKKVWCCSRGPEIRFLACRSLFDWQFPT